MSNNSLCTKNRISFVPEAQPGINLHIYETYVKNKETKNNNGKAAFTLSDKEFFLLKKKDSGIITKIFSELKNDIYGFIYYRTCGDIHESDEIFSDSTEALLKYIPKLKYNKSLKSLWIKITCGKISDYYKKKKRQFITVDKIKEDILIKKKDNYNEINSFEETYPLYCAALEAINEKYKRVILLRYKENRSIDEISKILKNNKKSIKNSLYRAKTALARKMNYYKNKWYK